MRNQDQNFGSRIGVINCRSTRVFRSPPIIRNYQRGDRPSVLRLLRIVPRLYPNGDQWLSRRLDEIEDNKAACTLAFEGGLLRGAIIDVSKGKRLRKICTLFVSENGSKAGIGSKLFNNCSERWLGEGVDKVYLTAASEVNPKLGPFLKKCGFQFVAIEENRYGAGRSEFVFSAVVK